MTVNPDSLEFLTKSVKSLRAARELTGRLLSALSLQLLDGRFLAADASEALTENLAEVTRLQDECLALLPASTTPPSSLSDLDLIREELEWTASLQHRAEQARSAIAAFTRLRCLDEDMAGDFSLHQERARHLLEHGLSDEEAISASEAYDWVVRLIKSPDAAENKSEIYRQINDSIGFVTRLALQQRVLAPPDEEAAASAELVAEAEQEPVVEPEPPESVENPTAEPDPADEATKPAPEPSRLSAGEPVSDLIDFRRAEYACTDKDKSKTNFSVNKFEGEMKGVSGGLRISPYVMNYIYNNGVLAISQADDLAPTLPFLAGAADAGELLSAVLRKLCQKGYLTEHAVTVGDDSDLYYSLSEYGAGAYWKETSRKFLQRSFLKPVLRSAEEEYLKLEESDAAIQAYRLRALNRVQRGLELKEPNGFVASKGASLQPYPHRELYNRRTKRRYLLIPGELDAADSEADLKQIIKVIRLHPEDVVILAVRLARQGTDLVRRLAEIGAEVYYWFVGEEGLMLGDAKGYDCLNTVLDLKEPELEELEGKSKPEEAEDEAVAADKPQVAPASSPPATTTASAQARPAPAQSEPVAQADETPAPLKEPDVIAEDELARVVETALAMVVSDRHAEAMLLLHSVAEHSKDVAVLRDKLAYVLDDPLRTTDLDGHTLAVLPVALPFYDGSTSLDDHLNAAIWLKTFFDPDNPNDYRLRNLWQQIKSDLSSQVLDRYPGIKQLAGFFWDFIERHKLGIKYCASSDVRDQLDITESLEQCRQRLEETVGSAFPRNLKQNINHPKIHRMVVDWYGNTGLLTQLLQGAFEMPIFDLREACAVFTTTDLNGEFEPEDLRPEDGKLGEYADKYWEEMDFVAAHSDKSDMLTGALRNRMLSRLQEAVEPLLRCYAYRRLQAENQGSTSVNPEVIAATREQAQERFAELLEQLGSPAESANGAGHRCLMHVIQQFGLVLGEDPVGPAAPFYETLLLTGKVELDARYLPIMDHRWLQGEPPIHGYRLWERSLKIADAPLLSWEAAAEAALRKYNLGLYDLIAQRHETAFDGSLVKETRRQARIKLPGFKNEFMGKVESAQNYDQIGSKDLMHMYFRLAEAAEKHAETYGNVGFFNDLLDACLRQISLGSQTRIQAQRRRLDELKQKILDDPSRNVDESDADILAQWPILDKIDRMLERSNITVAEDYLQLAAKGQRDMPSIESYNEDIYARFQSMYQMLFNTCNSHKSDDLNRTYTQSVKRLLFPQQRNRNTASADRFIQTWNKPQYLGEFMEQLIFGKVARVDQPNKQAGEYYVYPALGDVHSGQYPHPFEAFGTRAAQNGVRVLMMAGVRTADSLLNEVAQAGKGEGSATIVVLDYALTLADRSLLAKSVKLRSFPEIVAVVDRVMALFLAGYGQIERGNAFLMAALPSSRIQPYIPVGSIPPEMFIGRGEELEKIQNPSGPVFVYGGRQLGKTALLRESRNRGHRPDSGEYAVYVDLRNLDADASLRRISEELAAERVLPALCDSWDDLRLALRARLSDRNRPVRRLLLLLDEADAFIASCESLDYRPLELLKELRDAYNHQFKFVIAGLRDIVRFNKQRLGRNSVLAHLGHITIRPLGYLDARDLLLRPLQYIGFRIHENSEHIINLILAKTNYYPGLIHFYCEKLIEAITDSYRNGTYNEKANPPYVLDEKHIKTLLAQSEFLSEIEKKFRITLQLDTDNLYDVLATAMAHHYHEKGVGQGATAQDLQRICREFEVGIISGMTADKVEALMEEMDELNIFRLEPEGSGKYVFNRYSFFQMLGNDEQVFYHLLEYSGTGGG